MNRARAYRQTPGTLHNFGGSVGILLNTMSDRDKKYDVDARIKETLDRMERQLKKGL